MLESRSIMSSREDLGNVHRSSPFLSEVWTLVWLENSLNGFSSTTTSTFSCGMLSACLGMLLEGDRS